MGPLVASGGVCIQADQISSLEKTLNAMCSRCGFPTGEEFKWSPSRRLWMHAHLLSPAREEFFQAVVRTCSDHGARVIAILSDTESRTPAKYESHRDYVTAMLIERINWFARTQGTTVMVVADRPGGARGEEQHFLSDCLETLQNGTGFVRPDNMCINPVSTDSKFVRLLQAADLVTSCITAYVAGEGRYSPPLFASILPLIHRAGRIGGVGIKIHPDFKYVNLYHWLFGDEYFFKGSTGTPLPMKGFPYLGDAQTF